MPELEDYREVVVVDYDDAWPLRFEEEKRLIAEALRDVADRIVAVEHVDSTAVPGLAAKPIIDIMLGVRDLSAVERCVRPLEAIGYQYRGEAGIPGRLFFRKGQPRSHHLHMVPQDGKFWERHIRFRDLLRQRPELAAKYGALKKELAVRYRTRRLEYTEAKTPFIEGALAEVGRGR